jgi:S-(hydroxymethyl)glutathione dehydrogenase/alcohol dehydrogenase
VIGRPNLCERRQPGRGVLPDGTTRMSLRGRAVYHYGHVATYASSTVVHESCAIKIDPSVPLDRAALIGCSVMTGVGAVINTAAVPPGREHRGLRGRRRRPERRAGRRARWPRIR